MKKLSLLIVIILINSISIFGQTIPKQISYQGVLRTAGGAIVEDGNYQLTFKIYNTSSGGTALWSEAQTVMVTNGVFSVQFGNVTPIAGVAFNRDHYLGITIAAEPELSPRTKLTPTPYSFMAMDIMNNTVNSEKIVNLSITGTDIANNTIGPEKLNFTPGSGTIGGTGTTNYLPKFTNSTTLGNSVIYQNASDNIGIGTQSPQAKLDVRGNIITGLDGAGGVMYLAAQDNTNEGGQMQLNGAGSYADWYIDSYQNNLRIFKNSTATSKIELADGGTGRVDLFLEGKFGINVWDPVTDVQFTHSQFIPAGGFTLQQVSNSNRWQFYISQSSSYLRLLYNDISMGQFNNTNGNYEPVSDMRLKKNIKPMNSMLDVLRQLQPVTYQLLNNTEADGISYGLIAQDVEKVLPDIVSETKGEDGDGISDLRTISYTELIPILIKAVQEQQKIIEDLTKRIEALEGR